MVNFHTAVLLSQPNALLCFWLQVGSGRAEANDMPLPPPQRPSLRVQSTGLAGLMESAEAAGDDGISVEVEGDDDLVAGMPDAETIR